MFLKFSLGKSRDQSFGIQQDASIASSSPTFVLKISEDFSRNYCLYNDNFLHFSTFSHSINASLIEIVHPTIFPNESYIETMFTSLTKVTAQHTFIFSDAVKMLKWKFYVPLNLRFNIFLCVLKMFGSGLSTTNKKMEYFTPIYEYVCVP